ncbi:hypothetical protein NVS55_03175 [Myxococcus stipitatus]|uniref:hypothetical protein n=1 Tax=Myxococcus stipitatus TaxID=83455 RepID=UPI003144FDF5
MRRLVLSVVLLQHVIACNSSTTVSPAVGVPESMSSDAALGASRFANVQVFGGTLSFSSDASEKTFTDENGSVVRLSCSHEASGAVYLEQDPEAVFYWSGNFRGTASLFCVRTKKLVFPDGKTVTYKDTWTGPSHQFETNARVFLDPFVPPETIDDATRFAFVYGDDLNPSTFIPVSKKHEEFPEASGGPREELEDEYLIRWRGIPSFDFWQLPDSGLALHGEDIDEQVASCGEGDELITWRFKFDLVPLGVDEVRLILEAPPGYDAWRPKANIVGLTPDVFEVPPLDNSISTSLVLGSHVASSAPPVVKPGSSAIFKAHLVAAPDKKAKTMRFRLTSSRVPGVAGNSPLPGQANSDFDLALTQSAGTALVLSQVGELQVGTTPDGQYRMASVEVLAQDWGAYGKIEAGATMEDGTAVVAVLSSSNETELRIPQRAPGSNIATSWKSQRGASGRADSDDNESTPVGDGSNGDGLTLYEEYRGFWVQGKHVEGDPNKKDFFVHIDPTGLSSSSAKSIAAKGVSLFESVTALVVHRLDRGEFVPPLSGTDFSPDRRVINFNHDSVNHKVDQHLVVLTSEWTLDGNSHSRRSNLNALGTPKAFSRIEIAKQAMGQLSHQQLVRDVAHELGHTVNVSHHGEGGEVVRYLVFRPDGSLVEAHDKLGTVNPVVIRQLVDEVTQGVLHDDANRIPGPVKSTPVKVSLLPEKQHSGDENCVMRYNDANVVVRAGQPDVRYWIAPTETPGAGLCSDGLGKTFNKTGVAARPSRHGNAAVGRGNCVHQLLVNDAVPAPTR